MCWGLRGLVQASDILAVETSLGDQRNVIDNPINSINLRRLRVRLAAEQAIQEKVKWRKANKSRTSLQSG